MLTKELQLTRSEFNLLRTLISEPGKAFDFDEMIRFLKSEGAGVLLFPERLELIDALPETGVGKIDKKALRKDIEQKLLKEG